MIFIGEVEEWLLHPRVVLGVALEVLEGQLSGGVQAHLGRHQSPLCEVRLVAQQDSRHRLQPRCLLQLVQPGPGGGECLLPGDVIHDHHQGAALPQSPHHVVIDGPPGTVDHHQLHGVACVGDVDGPALDVSPQGHGVVLGEACPGVNELLDDGCFPHCAVSDHH